MDFSSKTRGFQIIAMAGLLSITAIGTAAAGQDAYTRAGDFYSSYRDQAVMSSPSRSDRADFDRSGTRGREGLGASAYHPEGPGNVSN